MHGSRTLVCVLAETRAHMLSWELFEKNLLHALGADLALCISLPDDYDYENPFWKNAKYKFTCPEFRNFAEGFDQAQAVELGLDAGAGNSAGSPARPDWRKAMRVRDIWLGGIKGPHQQPGSGGLLIYFRWLLWNSLRASNLLERYDRFIITRSDFIWTTPHPPLSVLDKQFIWIPQGEAYGGVTDRHAVLSPDHVEAYTNIIAPIVRAPDQLIGKMEFNQYWNIEQYILFSLKERQLGGRIRFFPYGMYTAREQGGKSLWSMGQWDSEKGYYIKYPNEYKSSMYLSKIVRGNSDWERLAAGGDELHFNSFLMGPDGKLFGTYTGANKNPYALLIDKAGDEGSAFFGTGSYGDYDPKQLHDVVFEKAEGGLHIRTKGDGAYYFVKEDGSLVRHASRKTPFRLIKRFFSDPVHFPRERSAYSPVRMYRYGLRDLLPRFRDERRFFTREKLNRHLPCPCGSGRSYLNCHRPRLRKWLRYISHEAWKR